MKHYTSPLFSVRRAPRIELICIGSELLTDKPNTNVIDIARELESIGLTLQSVVAVPDEMSEMVRAVREGLRRADVLLICGGLGPTFDDFTRECVAKVLRRPLIYVPAILKQIERRFRQVRAVMSPENKRQAYLIRGATCIENKFGTAPGQIIPLGTKQIVILPGPARELLPMMKEVVCPRLARQFTRTVIQRKVLHIFGVPESQVDEWIRPIIAQKWSTPNLQVVFGILAHYSIVDVKYSISGRNKVKVQRRALKQALKLHIYGEDNDTMESLIGAILTKKKQTLSVAESCTGGLLAAKITSVPGSSRYFRQGTVVYSNQSKMQLLGVSAHTLAKHGAVSEPTVGEMARGLQKKSGSDWTLSVTGIAGPSGGTKEKPVGTVCFGLASAKSIQTETRHFHGTREQIRARAVLSALDLLRRNI